MKSSNGTSNSTTTQLTVLTKRVMMKLNQIQEIEYPLRLMKENFPSRYEQIEKEIDGVIRSREPDV